MKQVVKLICQESRLINFLCQRNSLLLVLLESIASLTLVCKKCLAIPSKMFLNSKNLKLRITF